MLAHTEVEVAAQRVLLREVTEAFEIRVVRWFQVRRTAKQFGQGRCNGVEHLAGCCTGGHRTAVGTEVRHGLRPVRGQFTLVDALQLDGLLGIGRFVAGEQVAPFGLGAFALGDGKPVVRDDVVGDEEWLLRRPAKAIFGEADFLVTERSAVRLGAALQVRAAVRDGGFAGDQVRLSLGRFRRADGGVDGVDVVPIDGLHVPVVGAEAGLYVFGKGDVGGTLDGDAVVVVEVDQAVQSQMSGQRSGLVGKALHHIAIRDNRVDVVIEECVIGAVEARRQVFLRDRHADAVGEALSQRAGRRLDAQIEVAFGMTGRFAIPLPELLEVFDQHGISREVQQAVEQH